MLTLTFEKNGKLQIVSFDVLQEYNGPLAPKKGPENFNQTRSLQLRTLET